MSEEMLIFVTMLVGFVGLLVAIFTMGWSIRGEIANTAGTLRDEASNNMATLRAELADNTASLRGEITAIRDELTKNTAAIARLEGILLTHISDGHAHGASQGSG